MTNGPWAYLGPFTKILILLLIVLLSTVIFSVVSVVVALPFTGGFSWLDPQGESLSVSMLKYFQITQAFSLFIIPALLAGYFFGGHPTKGIGFYGTNNKLLIISILTIIACQPLAGYLGLFNNSMQLPGFLDGIETWMKQAEESASNLIFQFLDTGNTWQITLNVLMIAVLPALGEEMLFRGSLQPLAAQWFKSKHAAVWFTAFIFAAIHLQFFTFLPRFFLGVLLGYLMVWGKSLWYPVAGHFTNNLMALVVFYYYRAAHPDVNPLDPSVGELPAGWLLFGTIILAGLIIVFYRRVNLSGVSD